MAELTTIPTEYGFADQGFLADGLQPGATTAKIAPIFRTDNGVREARGFSTPRAFIFIELAGEYERASYGAMSVDPITKVTTLTDMRRDLSQEDGSDFTSHGPGGGWPKGARVVVSNDPALFGSYAVTGGENTFTALQTFSAGIDVTGKYIKSPVFVDAAARDIAIPSPANGMVCFVIGVGLQFYSGGSWNTVGSATVFNASTTVSGIVEEATVAEQGTATATGATGARLVPAVANLVKTSSGAGDENKIAVLDSTGKFASGFINTTTLGIPTVEDTALDSTWDNDTAVPTKNVVHDAFKELTLFPGSEVLIAAGTSASQQNFGTYQKRKELAMKCKGTVTVQMSVTISGGAGLRSRIYKNGVAIGTERSGSGAWDEDITVVKGDLLQIYQHDSSTNFPHSVTAFNILVSSVYGCTVLL